MEEPLQPATFDVRAVRTWWDENNIVNLPIVTLPTEIVAELLCRSEVLAELVDLVGDFGRKA